jgi:hypothetical protein
MESQVTSQVSPQAEPDKIEQITTVPVTEDKFKENFDRIAKQEKFQQETRKRLEAERLQLEQERAELSEYKKIKQIKSENPMEVLKLLGLSVDDVVRAANNPKNIDPVAAKALEAVEKLQAELKAERDALHKQKLTKVEQELTANIQAEIKAGEYDLIEQLELSHTVREYMEEIYDRTGEITDVKEACKAVNEYLAGNIKKVLGSKWLKPAEVEKLVEAVKEDKPKTTLTNKMVTEAPKTKKLMTDAEREQAAIEAMRNMIK